MIKSYTFAFFFSDLTPCPKMATTQLKSDAIMDLMKEHLSTDAGKEVTEKIGLVYQINIAPKVPFFLHSLSSSSCLLSLFMICLLLPNFQKLGFEEVTYIVDLKKGQVTKGLSFCDYGKLGIV